MSDVHQIVIKHLSKQWQLTEHQHRYLLSLDAAETVPELLKIDTTLMQLFAGCPQLAELWMTSCNKAFDNDSPMDVIEREGMRRLKRVVQLLCLAE